MFHRVSLVAVVALPLFLSACAGPPFSYAEDRCLGTDNQCRNSCLGLKDGGAQAACYAKCQDRQTQCYMTGDDGAASPLSQDSLIGYKRSEAEKQADYERWKAQKQEEEQKAEDMTDEGDADSDG